MTRNRRRCLFIAQLTPDGLAGSVASGADEVVLDLGGLPASGKTDFARLEIVAAMLTRPAATMAVQINHPDSRWFDEDIIQLVMAVDAGVDCMVVPDVESANQIRAATGLLDEIEAEFPVEHPIALEARITSSEGVSAIATILDSSPRLEAIVLDVDPGAERAAVFTAATRAGVVVIAGPRLLAGSTGPFAGTWSFATGRSAHDVHGRRAP